MKNDSKMVMPFAIYPGTPLCPYNRAVECSEQICEKCGWNPANTDLRNRRLIKILEVKRAWDEWDGE